MKNLKKGFTLIELLVVIAIIGILSSIVLASLSSARTKGEDAAIQSTLSNMRAQAELYYANNNNYGTAVTTTCTTGAMFTSTGTGGLKTLIDAATARGLPSAGCTASTTGWAVQMPLKGGGFACVDGNGNSVSSSTKASAYTISSGICS